MSEGSQDYEGEDLGVIAARAERDLNSDAAKQGHRIDDATKGNTTGQGGQGSGVSGPKPGQFGASDSTLESGVDESVTTKFPGSTVVYGSAASGAGDNRDIPEEEGGGINPATGQ